MESGGCTTPRRNIARSPVASFHTSFSIRPFPDAVSRRRVLTPLSRTPLIRSLQSALTVASSQPSGLSIWTIGHSTRSANEFAEVLTAYDIELLVDVRRFPGSRHLPQFESSALAAFLATRGIEYAWLASLGGRRRPVADSPNIGWRHPAFRAYADHVATEEFAEGLFELTMLATGMRTAIMCAEVLWWRCHRRIISDVLTSLGWSVTHIRDAGHAETHRLRAPGRVVRGRLVYS